MAQYIYTMNNVSKLIPPKREILKYQPIVFPGGKNWRARHQWCGQIDAFADYGRRGHRV